MLYIAQETPPLPTVLAVGIQHMLVALMLLIYVVIAGKGIGLADAPLRDFVSLSVVVMGLGTLLNSLTTRFSAGHLLVYIPDPFTMMAFIAVTNAYGPSAAAGGLLAGGIVVFGLGRFLPRLQVLFPPEVTGTLLVLLGMSLIPGGVERAIGLDRGGIAPTSILIAATTLGSLVAVSVWSRPRLRVLALIIGAAAGMLVAVLTGDFGAAEMARVAIQPPLSLPIGNYTPPTPTWVPAAIIPLVLVLVINAVDAVGCGVVIDKMNNEKWRRPDLPMIGRLLNGMGLCTIVSGLVGTLSAGISSANLGLAHMTGVAARRAGTMTGLLLIALACLPQIATFFILLPPAVVGAILIYTAGYVMVSGAQLIMSRMLNSRRQAVVGLGLAAGTAVFMVPGLTASVSPELEPILGSGLVVGTMVAIGLNLLFRIGVSRCGEVLLDQARPGPQATRFLEDCGADWGARPEVIARAGTAVGEALETLNQARSLTGPARLLASFDEYKLILTLEYAGPGIQFAAPQAVDWQALMDADADDAALAAAMATLPGMLIQKLADRVDQGDRDGRAQLRLQFDH